MIAYGLQIIMQITIDSIRMQKWVFLCNMPSTHSGGSTGSRKGTSVRHEDESMSSFAPISLDCFFLQSSVSGLFMRRSNDAFAKCSCIIIAAKEFVC
jgi:hypothetical protein